MPGPYLLPGSRPRVKQVLAIEVPLSVGGWAKR